MSILKKIINPKNTFEEYLKEFMTKRSTYLLSEKKFIVNSGFIIVFEDPSVLKNSSNVQTHHNNGFSSLNRKASNQSADYWHSNSVFRIKIEDLGVSVFSSYNKIVFKDKKFYEIGSSSYIYNCNDNETMEGEIETKQSVVYAMDLGYFKLKLNENKSNENLTFEEIMKNQKYIIAPINEGEYQIEYLQLKRKKVKDYYAIIKRYEYTY